jgi:hypothetical protein
MTFFLIYKEIRSASLALREFKLTFLPHPTPPVSLVQLKGMEMRQNFRLSENNIASVRRQKVDDINFQERHRGKQQDHVSSLG